MSWFCSFKKILIYIYVSYASLLYQRSNKRHGAMVTSQTSDLELHKMNSVLLQLPQLLFSPFYLSTRLSFEKIKQHHSLLIVYLNLHTPPCLLQQPHRSSTYSLNSQCKRSKSFGPRFHIRHSLCLSGLCLWNSERMNGDRHKDSKNWGEKGRRTTCGICDGCQRQYMFSGMIEEKGLGAGFWKTYSKWHMHTETSRATHSVIPCLTCEVKQMHQKAGHQLFNLLALEMSVSVCVCAHGQTMGMVVGVG